MMNWDDIAGALSTMCHIEREKKLSEITSLCVGGPARIVAHPKRKSQIESVLRYIWENDLKYIAIGRGTNLLPADDGYDGVVIVIDGGINKVSYVADELWLFEAGASLSTAIMTAAREGFRGLEALAGIPGSVGGAAKMNAGAYDVSFWQKTKSVELLTQTGPRKINASSVDAEYRRTTIPAGAVITSLLVELEKGSPAEIIRQIERFNSRRAETQPINERSAGCIFKNPAGMHAGMLIEKAGLKGKRIGGAMISPLHANFIINTGDATAEDIVKLIETIQETVQKKFGITLELEVIKVGFEQSL